MDPVPCGYYMNVCKCLKGTLLDEASGVKKKDTELVVVSKTPKQPSSGGWNKVDLIYSQYIDIPVSLYV